LLQHIWHIGHGNLGFNCIAAIIIIVTMTSVFRLFIVVVVVIVIFALAFVDLVLW
jgi:hypothetical protein